VRKSSPTRTHRHVRGYRPAFTDNLIEQLIKFKEKGPFKSPKRARSTTAKADTTYHYANLITLLTPSALAGGRGFEKKTGVPELLAKAGSQHSHLDPDSTRKPDRPEKLGSTVLANGSRHFPPTAGRLDATSGGRCCNREFQESIYDALVPMAKPVV